MNKVIIGKNNEEKACKYLTDNGYKIIDRNFRSKTGEIDIIAIKDKYICFIEVKYRKNIKSGTPEEAVNVSKMKKISKVSEYYLYINRKYINYQIRYDVIAMSDDYIKHYENAFSYIY